MYHSFEAVSEKNVNAAHENTRSGPYVHEFQR